MAKKKKKRKLEKIPPEKILKSKEWIPIIRKNYGRLEKNNLFIKYLNFFTGFENNIQF